MWKNWLCSKQLKISCRHNFFILLQHYLQHQLIVHRWFLTRGLGLWDFGWLVVKTYNEGRFIPFDAIYAIWFNDILSDKSWNFGAVRWLVTYVKTQLNCLRFDIPSFVDRVDCHWDHHQGSPDHRHIYMKKESMEETLVRILDRWELFSSDSYLRGKQLKVKKREHKLL